MSELQVIEAEIEKFLAKVEREGERLAVEAFAALKNTASLLAKNPAVQKALKDGLQVAVSTVLGAAEAGGAGAVAGAVESATRVLLKDVEAPAGSALIQIVQGEIAAAVAGPTAAIPEKVNP